MRLQDFYNSLPISPVIDFISLQTLAEYKLAAPNSFWQFINEDTSDVINGCGAGGFGDFLVPDKIYGMSVKPACKIHDWMYTIFNCEKGFELANQVFLDNMNRINEKVTKNRWLRWLRRRRILKYYTAVKLFGRRHYYDAHVGLYTRNCVYN